MDGDGAHADSKPMALGKGGADTITRAMVRVIEESGVEVRTVCTVAAIDVHSGQARGVVLTDSTRISAGKAVIDNIHPRIPYGHLLAPPLGGGSAFTPTPTLQVAAVALPAPARLRPGPATMMIHVALRELPAWRAGPELRKFAYVHIAPAPDQMARTYREAMAGLLPAEPVLVLVVGQPTVFDPGRALDGQHILWVQVRVLPADVRGDAAGALAAAAWSQLKEAYADRALALLKRPAPGIGARVLARHMMSPVDLERDNANLVGGDSLSSSHHLDQFFCFRQLLDTRAGTPASRACTWWVHRLGRARVLARVRALCWRRIWLARKQDLPEAAFGNTLRSKSW